MIERGSSPTIDAGGIASHARTCTYTRVRTSLRSDAASAIKILLFATYLLIYTAPLVEPVFIGDPGRRLRKGMSSGGPPVCLLSVSL